MSVSYTHLAYLLGMTYLNRRAVYARHRGGDVDRFYNLVAGQGTVSYTHLDVYKRQSMLIPYFERTFTLSMLLLSQEEGTAI